MGRPRVRFPCDKTCPVCKKVFHCKTHYAITEQEFCSRTCRTDVHGNGRSVEMVKVACATCGKEFETWPCLKETKKYCSYECMHSNKDWREARSGPNSGKWQGGNAKWWKRECRERDQRCLRCGDKATGKALHAHHLVPVAMGGTNELSNLISLCNRCHKRFEHRFLKMICVALPEGALDNIIQTMKTRLKYPLKNG